MATQYKEFSDKQAATEAAEALGILWAQSIGKVYTPTGVAPDVYGPGRQPEPREAFFQRYWLPPLDAVVADAFNPKSLPIRLEPDAFALAQDARAVDLKSKTKTVTLDMKGLKDASAQAEAVAEEFAVR